MASIYKIVNGNCYVGSTAREIKYRKTVHFSNLRLGKHHSPHLQHAYNKYGEEAFELQIVEELLFPPYYSKEYIAEYLINQEIYWIKCLTPAYNVCTEIVPGTLGKRHSFESIEKIRERSRKEDNMKHIREIQKIGAASRKGKPLSKELRLKIAQGKSGKRKINVYKNGTLVATCDLQKEAANIIGTTRANVSNVLCGQTRSAMGYTLKYKEV
jgi:group I intron endonuclease